MRRNGHCIPLYTLFSLIFAKTVICVMFYLWSMILKTIAAVCMYTRMYMSTCVRLCVCACVYVYMGCGYVYTCAMLNEHGPSFTLFQLVRNMKPSIFLLLATGLPAFSKNGSCTCTCGVV